MDYYSVLEKMATEIMPLIVTRIDHVEDLELVKSVGWRERQFYIGKIQKKIRTNLQQK